MRPTDEGWDWWSEVKLQILGEYLNGFTRAVRGRSLRRSASTCSPGTFDNVRRHGSGNVSWVVEGSPLKPTRRSRGWRSSSWPSPLRRFESSISSARPTIRAGGCSQAIATIRSRRRSSGSILGVGRRRLPSWIPEDSKSHGRRSRLWRDGGVTRRRRLSNGFCCRSQHSPGCWDCAALRGRRSAERLDRLYGTRDWVAIYQQRRNNTITPEQMRAEFVNLLRWRLQEDLGYKTTHALQIVNTAGQPVYTLVFATDSSPGDRIMAHVYDSAATRTIPTMRAQARAARIRRREDELGQCNCQGWTNSATRPREARQPCERASMGATGRP